MQALTNDPTGASDCYFVQIDSSELYSGREAWYLPQFCGGIDSDDSASLGSPKLDKPSLIPDERLMA